MLATFLLSNGIAWWLEGRRRLRILEKTKRLAAASTFKTPVTIVTGFLGSGKTTLVNRILTSHDHGKRIVVIENEVGALSIDDKILRASEQEKSTAGIFVMKNGCMCCSGDGAGPELERVLNHLLELLDQHEFGHVVIETSGLADPAPIMQTFFSHNMCGGRFVLDGVVTIVDAKNIWSHIQESNKRWWARS
jgi:G3E family GTPase